MEVLAFTQCVKKIPVVRPFLPGPVFQMPKDGLFDAVSERRLQQSA
jgi:hypothetical protein